MEDLILYDYDSRGILSRLILKNNYETAAKGQLRIFGFHTGLLFIYEQAGMSRTGNLDIFNGLFCSSLI